MNEEIKEILDYLRDENEYYNEEEQVIVNYGELIVEKEDIDKLLNYITSLQEDNKELNRVIELYGKSLYNADLTRYKEENQKLNKIIDELEKWLKERINRYEYSTGNMNMAAAGTLEATLNKLTELKKEVE